MAKRGGVVDNVRNPFAVKDWVDQGFGLTFDKGNRQAKLEKLFGKSVEEIKRMKRNDGRYPAFVGIRWGFAGIESNVLVKTEKWDNRRMLDEYGERLSPSHTRATMAKITKRREGAPHKNHSDFIATDNELDNKAPASRPVYGSSRLEKPMKHSTILLRESLVSVLQRFRPEPIIERYQQRDLAGKSPKEILSFTMGSSIYRAFHHEAPSRRYAQWRWHEDSNSLLQQLNSVRSQEGFDKLALTMGKSLVEDWGASNDRGEATRMNIGLALKIINLILKHLTFSPFVSNSRLTEFLHVPWDKFTLTPLQRIWEGTPRIPRSPGQGFVKNLATYQELHSFITGIAKDAGVKRIVYEFWAWDRTH
nr:hypothetical protein [Deltaproteobacteria bacterium]